MARLMKSTQSIAYLTIQSEWNTFCITLNLTVEASLSTFMAIFVFCI